MVLTQYVKAALLVWHKVLQRNRGLTLDYILNRNPAVSTPIFVDAFSSWGIGGGHGYDYFSVPHIDVWPHIHHNSGWELFPRVPIARLERLAALVAIQFFAHRYPGHILKLYSDNTNVVAWLSSRRTPDPILGILVSAIEQIKYHYSLKLSVRYIPSGKNRTADRLSRNNIPFWLRSRGSALIPDMHNVAMAKDVNNLLALWAITS